MPMYDIKVVVEYMYEVEAENEVEALQKAYDDIKDRKGMMIDGVFVKEEDVIRQGLGIPIK